MNTDDRKRVPPREAVPFVVSRAMVEAGSVSEPLQRLLSLLESPERCYAWKSRLQLRFEGFAEPPWLDEAVRDYMARLDERFPFWFFFLSQEDDSLTMLASCLAEVHQAADAPPGMVRIEPASMLAFIERQLGGLAQLYQSQELPETDRMRLVAQIERRFFGAGEAPVQ
jgi:hypothetical protein